MFPDELTTDRLRLERLSRDTVDTFALYEHCRAGAPNVEAITRYVTWSPHETPKETEEFLEWAENAWEERESAQYVIRPREGEDGAGEIAGACGLDVDWDRQLGTLGVWLRKRFWGRGYGTERAGALVGLAFDRLDLECVSVAVETDNDRSRAMVDGYVDDFGGRNEGVCRNYHHFEGRGGVDVVRYTVTQAEYRAATE